VADTGTRVGLVVVHGIGPQRPGITGHQVLNGLDVVTVRLDRCDPPWSHEDPAPEHVMVRRRLVPGGPDVELLVVDAWWDDVVKIESGLRRRLRTWLATGGGFIQLLIFILKHRSELRNLDATSGSAALTSANSYIATLQRGENAMRNELDKTRARIESMQKQWDIERAALTDALHNERRQVARLATDSRDTKLISPSQTLGSQS
jgi:hypothetical protein